MNIFDEAVELWGEEHQLCKAIEECSELIQAICKYQLDPVGSRDKVLEEMADASLMIQQLINRFGREEYETAYNRKLFRLKLLIDEARTKAVKEG